MHRESLWMFDLVKARINTAPIAERDTGEALTLQTQQ